jgi:hypothetical protein
MALTGRKLKPLLDRVLVEKIVAPTRTAAGILLPETTTKVHKTMLLPFSLFSFMFLTSKTRGSVVPCTGLLVIVMA